MGWAIFSLIAKRIFFLHNRDLCVSLTRQKFSWLFRWRFFLIKLSLTNFVWKIRNEFFERLKDTFFLKFGKWLFLPCHHHSAETWAELKFLYTHKNAFLFTSALYRIKNICNISILLLMYAFISTQLRSCGNILYFWMNDDYYFNYYSSRPFRGQVHGQMKVENSFL